MEQEITGLIIFYIGCGNLSKQKAKEHILAMKEALPIKFPKNIQCLYIPVVGSSIKSQNCDVKFINLTKTVDNDYIKSLESIIGDGKENLINVRISKIEKSLMQQKSKEYGFKNLSEYLRFVGLNTEIKSCTELKND